MAVKARNKTSVTLTFWPYRMHGDKETAIIGDCGHLVQREDGSYALTVERGKDEQQARHLIAELTEEGVIGLTKVRPQPLAPRIPQSLRPTGRRTARPKARPTVAKRDVEELEAALDRLMYGSVSRLLTIAQMSNTELFLAEASLSARVVALHLQDRYGEGVFAMLVEHGLVGNAFWLFYKGECFKDEDGDPIGELYRLLNTPEVATLASKYTRA